MGRFSFANAPRKHGVRIFRDGNGEPFENYRTLILVGPSIRVVQPIGPHAQPQRGDSLAERYPQMALEWHLKWNNGIKPEETSWSSNYLFYWKCARGHQWVATLNSRTSKKEHGCPCCSSRKVTSENNLAKLFPDHAEEWHPTKNGDLTPRDVTPYTHQKVYWKRRDPPYDSWVAPVSYRTAGPGTGGKGFRSKLRGSSVYEALIYWQMKHLFEGVKNRLKVADCELDVAIPSHKIGIEYDSYFYHKNKATKDIEKILKLEKAGWRVVRVREKGLKKERKDDLVLSSKEHEHYKWKSIERLARKVVSLVGINRESERYLKEQKLRNLVDFRRSVIHIRNVSFENSLLSKFPGVAQFWDDAENYPLTARDVSARDNNNYNFKCPICGDKFISNPANMVRSRISGSKGCLNCAGRKVTSKNNLRNRFPDLVKKSWDFNRNNKPPESYADSSNQHAYWVCCHCQKSHLRSINSVTGNQDARRRGGYFVCRACKGREMREAGASVLIPISHRIHPILRKEWDAELNIGLDLKSLTREQAKKNLAWICSLCARRFLRKITVRMKNLNRGSHGCPECRYSRSMVKKTGTLSEKMKLRN